MYVFIVILRVVALIPGLCQTKLQYIFETTFPEKENKLAPITLWGVPIDPLRPVGDARVSVILVKFLRARCVQVSSVFNFNRRLIR